MRKIVITIVLVLLTVLVTVSLYNYRSKFREQGISAIPTQTPSNIESPAESNQQPNVESTTTPTRSSSTVSTVVNAIASYRLQIPKLGINASIESVGLDSKGRMDVPKSFFSVGLYSLGFKPGDNGSAVLSGHYDTVSGNPAIFNKLSNLVAGDQIIITKDNNEKLTFVVSEVQNYLHDQLPLERIFATSGRPGLNLITCAGSWDRANRNYTNRLVVYAVK